ncbi:hypothetical protein PR202_gb15082 [Eleusine coracana subsp. coracana]|uniref:2-phytyl-1,4-beta-naphthoquinone methyltransferase, chloroplastic n=1 Tax=Eleusine coracana subsp. coracana TaxID=191504 RepID=A0AAV5EWY8_ELECO|nr:hypothetical protein PR202_gb15082 [Eleusine coracana subsp. coracana]
MGTWTATISVAAAAVVSPAGRRRGRARGPGTVRCSSSASVERQALFNRIAPVYDHLNDVLSLGQHRTWKRICVSWSRYRASGNHSRLPMRIKKTVFYNCLMQKFSHWKHFGLGRREGIGVLDLCCGSGDMTFLLSQKVGLDGEVGGVQG